MATNTVSNPLNTDEKNLRVVSNFNQPQKSVNGAEYDYVLSFFKRSMNDPDAAKSFTESVYQVSRQSNIPVIDVVKSLEGQSGMELTASLAYFLNGVRSNSTMLGVTNIVPANFFAGRSVLS